MDGERIRVWVERAVLDALQERYPELQGLTYTGRVNWAVRKLLTVKETPP